MADSVGSIGLSIELEGAELDAQINSIGAKLTKQLENSVKSATGLDFSKLTSGISKQMSDMSRSINSAMDSMNNSINKTTKSLMSNVSNAISDAQKKAGSIKVPIPKMATSGTVSSTPLMNANVNSHAPPMKINLGGADTVTAQINKLANDLDLTNNKAGALEQKLRGLKEELNNTFSVSGKNKLTSQIQSTEFALQGLINKSDATASKISILEDKLSRVGSAAKHASSGTKGLSKEISSSANTSNRASQSISKQLKDVTGSTRHLTGETKKLSSSAGSAGNNGANAFGRFGRSVGSALRSMMIAGTVILAIRSLVKYVSAAAMTNADFANSFHQVQANLATAFQPIFTAILPALNALMSGLATATTYIAMFMSYLFGTTYTSSFKAAKSMNTAMKSITGSSGGASKKVKQDMNEIKGALAGFDEINTLSIPKQSADDGGGEVGGGGGVAMPEMAPPRNLDELQSKFDNFISGIKNSLSKLGFDFGPLEKSLGHLKDSLSEFGGNVWDGLKWGFDNILVPLGRFVINEVAPRVIELLASALDVLNAVIDALKPLWQWLWDNLFKPIAEWTGGIVVSVLTDVKKALDGIGEWIKNNQETVQNMTIIIGSFAAAWLIVTAAVGIWNLIGAIATGVTTALGSAVMFLLSPVGIAIIIIGALIAVGVLLYKNWDTVKAFLIACWEGIKNAAMAVWNGIVAVIKGAWDLIVSAVKFYINLWLTIIKTVFYAIESVFTTVWNGIKGFITGIVNGIKDTISSVWEGIKSVTTNVWEGIKKAIIGPIEWARDKVKGIIDAIKGFFSFNVSWPHIPMPTFSLAPSGWKMGDLLKGSIPYLDISWHAQGGVFDQPSVIGVGEAGSEAVVPLKNNTQWAGQMAELLLAKMPQQNQTQNNSDGRPIELIINMGGTTIIRQIIEGINAVQREAGKTLLEV